jgi:hypothetical protein
METEQDLSLALGWVDRRSDESRTTASALRLSCYIVAIIDDIMRPNMAYRILNIAASFSATMFWPNFQ